MRMEHELFSPRTDRQAARKAASKLLAQTMAELEHFVREDGARVNPNRWKALAARESLQMHRERDHVSPNSPSRSLLVSGRLRGRVEHALFAAASDSLEQLALLNSFIFGDAVMNSAVVASLEPPPAYVSDGQPHRDDWLLDACFLSIKSVSRRGKVARESEAGSSIQYLEYNGFTRRPKSGELVGFYLLSPSVDLSSTGAEPSVRCLYRQLNNDVIDVFLLASGDVSRASSSSRSSTRGLGFFMSAWSSLITTESLFNIANLLECAEAKRLTIMMRENRLAIQSKQQTNDPDVIALLESTAAKKKSACGVCQRKKKIFHTFSSCDVCSQTVCTRCRLQRRVFVPRFDANGTGTSGGFFQKITTCKPCVVLATTGANRLSRAMSAMPVNPQQQHEQQQQHEVVQISSRAGRTRGKSQRFRIQSTSTPRGLDRRMRTDSNGSASSMPTPHGSKATPKGGIKLFSYNDDDRTRKLSSASDTAHWRSVTPRGGHDADWKHQEQYQHQHHQPRQQQERFPRFGPGFTGATTPGSTRSKEPMGFAIPADNEYPDAPPVKYALHSHSTPSTPSSSSTQSWSTTTSSAAASPSNLMQRMMELRKLAEISYDTTQRNNDIMTQHRRS
jgi:hypothetical protein